jgi:predicted ester cyclase
MKGAAAHNPAVWASSSAVLREPLIWAAIAAFVGTTVGLAGTLSWLAWKGMLNTSTGPIPVPPLLASWAPPAGGILATLSLFGVCWLLGRGSWTVRAASVLLLLWLAASLSFIFCSALWIPEQIPASGKLPIAFLLLVQVSLWSGPAATLLLALGALLTEDKRQLGAVLLGLGILGQPLVFAFDALPGEIFYLSASTVLWLGWPSSSVNLPEAALFILLGVLLLREGRSRVLDTLWKSIAQENREKIRRLYQQGFGRGNLSVVEEIVAEDFRDLRHGERGKQGMERIVLTLRESFPDLRVSVEEQEADYGLVRTRLTLSGTDRGGVLWFPPTGRHATFSAHFEDRFRTGELVQHDGKTDTEGLLRQLGHTQEETSPAR